MSALRRYVGGAAPLSKCHISEKGKPQTGSQPSGPGASGPPSHYEHVQYGNDDGRLHQGKGSARALHPAAGPALYKTGPVDCHRVPTSAPPGRKDGFYLHHDVEDVCRSDRRAAGVGEESAQGARSCDLEGNRAGLAASSTSEMLCRSQWSRSGLSECIHIASSRSSPHVR